MHALLWVERGEGRSDGQSSRAGEAAAMMNVDGADAGGTRRWDGGKLQRTSGELCGGRGGTGRRLHISSPASHSLTLLSRRPSTGAVAAAAATTRTSSPTHHHSRSQAVCPIPLCASPLAHPAQRMRAAEEEEEEGQLEAGGAGGATAGNTADATSSPSVKPPGPLNPFDPHSQPLPSLSSGSLSAFLSHPFLAGAVYYNESGSVEYTAGTAPLILSVPHGGHRHSAVGAPQLPPPAPSPSHPLQPLSASPSPPVSFHPSSSLPDRVGGCHEKDLNTQELGRAVHAELRRLLPPSCIPHLVISRVHRRKVDLNRHREDSAECEEGRRTWDDYHACVLRAKWSIVMQGNSLPSSSPSWLSGGAGLLVDLHGQRHDSRCQLGYLLNSNDLTALSSSPSPPPSPLVPSLSSRFSLHSLWQRSPSRCSLLSIVSGELSLGRLLEERGFPCLPSPSSPAPESGLTYFNGGATTSMHGSAPRMLERKKDWAADAEAAGVGKEAERDRWKAEVALGSAISSMQIETAYRSLRDTAQHRQRFAAALASALLAFMDEHAAPAPPDG